MIDYGMLWWHLIGFAAVVMAAMWVFKLILPDVQGFGRVALFGIVVAGSWYAHSNYYIQSGPFLRDTLLAPVLGKRPPAERLAYVLEAKAWSKPEIRRELQSVSVFERPAKALQLAYQGIPQLGDSAQMRWLHLSARLTELGQGSECTALMRGTIGADLWFRMLNRLTEAEIKEFFNVSLDAIVSGTAPASASPVTATDTNAIMQSLVASVPLHEQARFKSAVLAANLGGGNSADACWMMKTIFSGFERLPYASRVALLTVFANDAQKNAVRTAQLR